MGEKSIFINSPALEGGSLRTTINLLKGFIFPVDYSGESFVHN
jgi:hypothetical protein